jgi:hypothetical protein
LKKVLEGSPDLTTLSGEEESYIKLTGNGYGITSTSDAFTKLENPKLFQGCISGELEDKGRWSRRLPLQFKGEQLAKLLDDVHNVEGTDTQGAWRWLEKHKIHGYYDGAKERFPFKEMAYEMPPYVFPKRQEKLTDTLLLKAPYNIYRPGIMEQVYPKAEFSYVTLLRNPAATINGLISGWRCNYGFHKHLTPYGWWKFEAPPGWEEYVHKTVPERTYFQWLSGVTRLINLPALHTIRFEELLSYPKNEIEWLCQSLEIQPPTVRDLPQVMSTEKPEPFRWKKREDTIMKLFMNDTAHKLLNILGYQDSTKWM